jgi:ribonuclease HI
MPTFEPIKTSGITAFFDGATWPNPGGPAAAGALVKRDGVTVFRTCSYLGDYQTTNNVAEYSGLILILNYLIQESISETATIYGDSNLVIQQMLGNWEIKEPTLKKPRWYASHAKQAKALAKPLNLKFQWIPRELNTEADKLSNQPLIDRGIRNPYR